MIPIFSQAQVKTTFGRFNSRAIFTQSDSAICPMPLVILIPGSGANGPEEMAPASAIGDNKDHSIFDSFSKGLVKGHVGTLAAGKPGVDFFKSWEHQDRFYDENLYRGLGWQDLINNLGDAVEYAKSLPCVNANKIIILGHSQGTDVAVDYAHQKPQSVKGLILVGFSGENIATTLDWQFFRRPIDSWLELDVDANHDGQISREEASAWPQLSWD